MKPSLPIRFSRGAVLAFVLGAAAMARAQNAESRDDEYRVTVFPYHNIKDNLTGFGYLGYVTDEEHNYQTYYVGWPGFNYIVSPKLQVWTGLITIYTNNVGSADRLELRPFIGPKFFLKNNWKWNIYNFTRLEYRAFKNEDTGDWTDTFRLRSRFGVEFPLTSRERAWKPKTWYGLADVEGMYRTDREAMDLARLRVGIARVVNDRLRVELIYHWQYQGEDAGSLAHTNNIIRLNIKIGLHRGILDRTQNPSIDD